MNDSTAEVGVTADVVLRDCTVLGGAGYQVEAGEGCALVCFPNCFWIEWADARGLRIPFAEVVALEVGGPGVVTTGGGFVGGGFGVAGAFEGIAMAAVLNALTTKSKIYTFIAITTNTGEIHLHFPGMEPGALRVAMSRTYSILRSIDPDWIAKRRHVLDSMHDRKLISVEEHHELVERLMSLPGAPALPGTALVGKCPSCGGKIAFSAGRCRCGAIFVEPSVWRVQLQTS